MSATAPTQQLQQGSTTADACSNFGFPCALYATPTTASRGQQWLAQKSFPRLASVYDYAMAFSTTITNAGASAGSASSVIREGTQAREQRRGSTRALLSTPSNSCSNFNINRGQRGKAHSSNRLEHALLRSSRSTAASRNSPSAPRRVRVSSSRNDPEPSMEEIVQLVKDKVRHLPTDIFLIDSRRAARLCCT